MNCRECEAQLGAHLDDELPEVVAAEVESHLRGCSECAGMEERLLAVRDALRLQLPPLEVPPLLEGRIRSAIRTAAPATGPVAVAAPRRPMGNTGRLLATAAALLLAVAGTWRIASQRAASDRLVESLVAGHVRSMIGTHLTDVETSDQHTVKPWFNGKLDYSPPVHDFSGLGYPLIGGRLDYIDGRTVSALVYGRRQHRINVFLWPADRDRVDGSSPVSRQGYHLLHWNSAEYAYWVVSDLGATELEEFARMIRQADSVAAVPE